MEENKEEPTEGGAESAGEEKSARGTIIYLIFALIVMAVIIFFMVRSC